MLRYACMHVFALVCSSPCMTFEMVCEIVKKKGRNLIPLWEPEPSVIYNRRQVQLPLPYPLVYCRSHYTWETRHKFYGLGLRRAGRGRQWQKKEEECKTFRAERKLRSKRRRHSRRPVCTIKEDRCKNKETVYGRKAGHTNTKAVD